MHHEFRYGILTALTRCTKMDGTRGHGSRVGVRVGAHVWLRCIWLVRHEFLSVEVVFIVGVGSGFESCVCCSEVLCQGYFLNHHYLRARKQVTSQKVMPYMTTILLLQEFGHLLLALLFVR